MNSKKKVIIQFNESNFNLINKYCDKFQLSNLKKILDLNEIKTSSEEVYEYLEPWIQWYSFYTGMPYKEHKTFNLGDCLKKNHTNFVEKYAHIKKVSAFSSMNLKPSCKYVTYIPDPWTEASAKGSFVDRLVSTNLRNIINENASLSLSPLSLLGILLLIGFPKNLTDLKVVFRSFRSFLNKDRSVLASCFDYFITKFSLKRIKYQQTDLSLFFLNGLAHVQHHYFLESEFVEGENPKWYSSGKDEVLSALKIYDSTFKKIFNELSADEYEIWIITGLTQDSYDEPFCYWRFKDHKNLLSKFLDKDFEVIPRMTRDFEIKLKNKKDMESVKKFLEDSIVKNFHYSQKAFENINITSESTIFASFSYNKNYDDVKLVYKNIEHNLDDNLNFIALKNAGHVQYGWAFTNAKIKKYDKKVPIWELSKIIMDT
tara:strand:- start:2425 stop:3711 length:1287 start_codon:yes stop_codon:yes gene_type:complete